MFKFTYRHDAHPIIGTPEGYGTSNAGELTITVRSASGVLVTMQAANVTVETAQQ